MLGEKQGGLVALDPSMKEQLLSARERIIAQLDDIDLRMKGGVYGHPDYTDVAAELEGELREIDSILDGEDETDA
jgi:hypothetical protein